jgi:ribosomal protein L40E
MVYCSNCGEKIPNDATFCPKCGTKVLKGVEAKVTTPSDEVRGAFSKMSQELEKAFTLAANEMQAAFQTARENIQKSLYKEPLTCLNCGEKNPSNATFCFKCGKKIDAKTK